MNNHQFRLLARRRFAPFFLTQFLGAMNDNIFKNALILLLVFNASYIAIETNTLINLAAMLFILPFFLFSGLAGRVADKYDKAMLIRRLKFTEMLIMTMATAAFFSEQYVLLLAILFLMGTQSAFFGPIKYAILPQHLATKDLLGGNALVEMGTFLAILLGTLIGGLLVGLEAPTRWVSLAILICACLGFLVSFGIPGAPANNPDIVISANLFQQAFSTLKKARADHNLFMAMLAISWFWFMGASYLTQIPNFVSTYLNGNNEVVTLVLAAFSVGIGVGSLLCEKLSRRIIELGIVPIGSIGISLFGVALYLKIPEVGETLLGARSFFLNGAGLPVLFCIFGIGLFGGFFIVPLYAWVQSRSKESERSQMISAMNIMNALLMVLSAISGVLMLSVVGLSIPEYFFWIAIVNLVVAGFVYRQMPMFMVRFLIWVLSHTIYRVKHVGLDQVPAQGPAVLVCNNVSYMDSLIIGGAAQRPIRFVMFYKIFNAPALNWFFKVVKAIPIASQKAEPELYQQAFDSISEALRNGELVCIFPEGKLTSDGEIDVFRRGVERIIERDPVPVVPMALKGLWGSFFSRQGGPAFKGLPKRFWSRVQLMVDKPIEPDKVSADFLRERVLGLINK